MAKSSLLIDAKVSAQTSVRLVEFVLAQKQINQEELAELLEVSPSFVSRLRAGERSLTLDHLDLIGRKLEIPVGAMLLAAIAPPKPDARFEKARQLAIAAIEQGDRTRAAIKASSAKR
jgi:transcriptional regulator with XRE-family HTH domain